MPDILRNPLRALKNLKKLKGVLRNPKKVQEILSKTEKRKEQSQIIIDLNILS